MPQRKRQHYVPRFYLRNFSPGENGKAIGVYTLATGRFIRFAKLKNQAYRDYFYGKSGRVEEILSEFDDFSASAVARVLQTNFLPRMSSPDRFYLLMFAVFLHYRTLYSAEESQEMLEKVHKVVASHGELTSKSPYDFQGTLENHIVMSLDCAADAMPFVWDMEYRVLINKTDTPLITSDNPSVFYNQLMEHKKTFGSNTGLGCRGLQIFLPLSPSHCILFYDNEMYRVGGRKKKPISIVNPKDIETLNLLQAISARCNLYFGSGISEEQIEMVIATATPYYRKRKANVDEYISQNATKERGSSLIHTYHEDIRCNLSLSFINRTAKGHSFHLSSKVVYPRNAYLFKLYNQFRELKQQDRYKHLKFRDFLASINHRQEKSL